MTAIVDDLKRDEGWRESVYDDATGQPVNCVGFATIGFGFMIDAKKGGRIPMEIAEHWLAYLVREKQCELEKRAPWVVQQHPDVQRALLNMAYQMGVGGLLAFQNTLGKLQAGDRVGAAASALKSAWAQQTPARAKRVTDLIRGYPL